MTFEGFLCLMQISTKEQNLILDVLKLKDSVKMLQPVFENPNIIKVFYAGHNDLKWLNRDF